MHRVTFLTGTFILSLLASEGRTALMEDSPSPKSNINEEKTEIPFAPSPQEEKKEMPLVPPLKDLTPHPSKLEDLTPPPRVHHKKAEPKRHRKSATGSGSLPYIPPLVERMQTLCHARQPDEQDYEAISKACEALGCSGTNAALTCYLKRNGF